MVQASSTGFLTHESYMWYHLGAAALNLPAGGLVESAEHCYSPVTIRRFQNILERADLMQSFHQLRPQPADPVDVLRFHDKDYYDRVLEVGRSGGGDVGDYASLPGGGDETVMLSAGGAVIATDAVVEGRVRNAFALLRPAGHHAEKNRGRGFCIFGNSVIAVMKAQAVHGLGRVVIVDWDVHHGNGTQSAFYEDPNVLTISIHQDRLYPHDSGMMNERGAGRGEGYNINVPLPAGSGHEAYLATMERVVLPAIERYRPDLIAVGCGFDACCYDPLARMMLYSDSYREMTRMLMDAADRHCDGKLMIFQEGGYSREYTPFCGMAVMEQLSGATQQREDPFMAMIAAHPGQRLEPHQEAIINQAAALVASIR
ncbi:class II histone deacetylase [Mesorhizobium sp. M8A.F.Ca.ET.173.01.1.1]|nr:class II histone deacetylase [Mesorhizobium sp. M8A.F.Ca.ET.173.01.1.1]